MLIAVRGTHPVTVGRAVRRICGRSCGCGELFSRLRRVGCGGPSGNRSGCSRGRSLFQASCLFAILFLLQPRDLYLNNSTRGRIGGHRPLAVDHLLDHLIIRKFLGELLRTHAQRAKRRQAGIHRIVWNLLRVQLQVDPSVHSDRHHLLDIAWARTKCQAIQGLHRPLLLVRPGIGSLVLLLGD